MKAFPILLLVTLGLGASASSGAGASCPEVPHVGAACATASGLLAVFADDGTFLGYTHGVDTVPPSQPTLQTLQSSAAPACVINPTSSDYYTKVIYAHPSDVADSWATKKATIVSTLASANGYVTDAAARTGGAATVKVQCDTSGNVLVFDAALAHTRTGGAGDFNTVSSDLQALGYTEINAKHWVFVDGGSSDICSCGVGNLYGDETLASGNFNNGVSGSVPEFAVDWSWANSPAHIAMHELSHNMGAVQQGAPHSTTNFHCRDGLDTMCYQDGSANQCTSGFSCPGVCSVEVYDCNNDDYFHASPPAGNYLATHWNLGNQLNRFLQFAPQIQTLSCTSPIGVTQSTTCSFVATFSSTLTYTVAWGDGATTCVPSCSTFVASGSTQSATHTYATGGSKTVAVTATSSTTPARTSPAATTIVVVDAVAPTTTIATSAQPAQADHTAARAWFNAPFTFTLSAVDTGGTGVQSTSYAIDGGANVAYASAVTVSASGAHGIAYFSADKGANVEATKTKLVGIDAALPTANVPTLTPGCAGALGGCFVPDVGVVTLGSVHVAFSGADALSGLQSLTLFATGPTGTAEPITNPACSASLAKGTTSTVAASCDYAGVDGAPGEYCFTTQAIDEAGNARTTPLAGSPCVWILPG